MALTKSDVFVSYDHDDRKLADRIKEDLMKSDVRVWIDEDELRAGHPLIARIQEAIKKASNFVLLWSRRASRSRWVNAEWSAAWHLEKTIIPCMLDKEPLPPFLHDVVWCTFPGAYQKGLDELLSALGSGKKPKHKARPAPAKHALIRDIYSGQNRLLTALDAGNLKDAKSEQRELDPKVRQGLKEKPADAEILNLAANHKKNDFMLRHWDAMQKRQYPTDRLLSEAEALFYKSLAVEPDNPGAINGLGSVLALRGDIDAAEFFVRRAIDLSKKQGMDYPAARDDLKMIRMLKRERPA